MAGKTSTKSKDQKAKKVSSDADANQEHMHQTDTSNTDNTRNPGAEYQKGVDTSRQLDSNPQERQRLADEGKMGSAKP